MQQFFLFYKFSFSNSPKLFDGGDGDGFLFFYFLLLLFTAAGNILSINFEHFVSIFSVTLIEANLFFFFCFFISRKRNISTTEKRRQTEERNGVGTLKTSLSAALHFPALHNRTTGPRDS